MTGLFVTQCHYGVKHSDFNKKLGNLDRVEKINARTQPEYKWNSKNRI